MKDTSSRLTVVQASVTNVFESINAAWIARVAILLLMIVPIAVGAIAAAVRIGVDAGYEGAAGYVADLFDRWS